MKSVKFSKVSNNSNEVTLK